MNGTLILIVIYSQNIRTHLKLGYGDLKVQYCTITHTCQVLGFTEHRELDAVSFLVAGKTLNGKQIRTNWASRKPQPPQGSGMWGLSGMA